MSINDESPTGVLAKASIDTKRFDFIYEILIKAGKNSSSLSPLSPTEDLLKGY